MDSRSLLTYRYRHGVRLLILCALLILPLLVHSASSALAPQPKAYLPLISLNRSSPLPFPNCRYGSIPILNTINDYDIAPLNMGWYLTAATSSPARPDDILPIHVLHLKGRSCSSPDCSDPEYWPEAEISPELTEDRLGLMVDSNPGSIWLVGNEPDRVYYMDDVLPSQYAQAYYEIYSFIKARDPSASVGVGGVVVPTPLRLEYLDSILDEYKSRYSKPMPVDVWNTHVHIVREVRDDWGADVPPGSTADTGILFAKSQHDDIETFRRLILDFRSWMAAHGQQDRPLIISEFGILWPDWLRDEYGDQFDIPRVLDFMHETMTWLDSYADPALGYPADNYRLVQRWNWYSMDDDSVLPDIPQFYRWNGWLFESETKARSVFGDAFAGHTRQIWPSQDLVAYRIQSNSTVLPLVDPGETATVTLQITVSNGGNLTLDQPFSISLYEEISGTLNLIATELVTVPVSGCGGILTVEMQWPGVNAGAHQILIVVDMADFVTESSETNNEIRGTIVVPTDRLHLPMLTNS